MINKATKFALILYVSTYLLLSSYLSAQESPTQSDLDNLARTISTVQNQISETRQERNSVELEIESNEKAINAAESNIAALQSKIQNSQNRLLELEAESKTVNSKKQEQQTLIAQYIRTAYLSGKQEYLKLLFNQENISQSARMLRYYQYFNQARSHKISEFEANLLKIESISREIRETSINLTSQRDQLLIEQDSLFTRQNQRTRLLSELEATLENSSNELSRLELQYKEMELLIQELSRTILNLSLGTEGEDFASLRGALPWPIEGRLLNGFGDRYELGDLNWEGVTIAGLAGTNIHAIHHGRVVYADWFSSSGLLLIIDHGDGYMSLYAHNQSLYKEVGEWVNNGEIIAAIGNTGGRSENGVYFEIRYNGEAQDPVSWLVRR